MLKIKDNVDLKELEKFGFTKKHSYYTKRIYEGKDYCVIGVYNGKDKRMKDFVRAITKYAYMSITRDYDTIYDLIQAGLVEKVDNNE